MSELIYSTIQGTSADVMKAIAQLYIPKGALACDLTFHKGTFWKTLDGWCEVVGCDIDLFRGVRVQCDLRYPPFRDDQFDVVVIDPPFGNGSTKVRHTFKGGYNLQSCMTPEKIRELYSAGLATAHWILRRGGILIVKVQPMVNSGKQYWLDQDVYRYATSLYWMEAVDRFVMLPKIKGGLVGNQTQRHARKWGSFFWIFRNMKRRKNGRRDETVPCPRGDVNQVDFPRRDHHHVDDDKRKRCQA